MTNFAKALRRVLEARKISQAAASRETGISRAHVNNLACGRKNPSKTLLDRLVEGLGLSRNQLRELREAAAKDGWNL